VAVVGHVEWVTHARGAFPPPGGIARLADPFDEPAGGGAVAAAQIAKLGVETHFFTALGADEAGERAASALRGLGVRVHAARREQPQTRAVSVTGPDGDRSIAVVGAATDARADDDLPWELLGDCDGAYFTGRDPETLRRARAARRLVVTARRRRALVDSRVGPDVVLGSASDPDESLEDLDVDAEAWVLTEGGRGGRHRRRGGSWERFAPADPPGPAVDTYGCGDSFAGGLTAGLARGLGLADALRLGARCGAAVLTGRGGLAAQLRGGG
jgi:ribokinase